MPRCRFLLSLCCLLSLAPLSAKEAEERLALKSGADVMPSDRHIGPLDNGSEDAVWARSLLSEPYGLAWVEKWVEAEDRESFTSEYGPLLSSLLPQEGVVCAKTVEGPASKSLAVRLSDGRYLTLAFTPSRRLLALSLLSL